MGLTEYTQAQVALGSEVTLSLVTSDSQKRVDTLFQKLWKQIFYFERQFSRFLPHSELSAFNRTAGLKQPISSAFCGILLAARRLGEETGGLYNPFILPALQNAGYDHSLVQGYEKDPQDDYSHLGVPEVNRLEIHDTWARIPYGSALDLGGCGKGYLADQLAEVIEPLVTGYWLSLGGDVVASGTNAKGKQWEIGIQQATGGGISDIGLLVMPANGRGAVATSGVLTRRGTKQGRQWHHIIDPRTLRPSQTDIRLATVYNASALRADVLASCAVIVGSAHAIAFLADHDCPSALIQYELADRSLGLLHKGPNIKLDEPYDSRL